MRRALPLILLGLLLLTGWIVWPYLQPAETQVSKCHEKLFSLAGQRYWSEASEWLSPEYHDQWENNRTQAIELAGEAFRGFIILDLKWETAEISVNEGEKTAEIRGKISLEGSGAGISQMLITKVNNLKEPWLFTWKKEGGKPTSWRLISVKHPELEGLSVPDL